MIHGMMMFLSLFEQTAKCLSNSDHRCGSNITCCNKDQMCYFVDPEKFFSVLSASIASEAGGREKKKHFCINSAMKGSISS